MTSFFKKLRLFAMLIFVTAKLNAQQNHFIYLQTENKQPFYVKLDKKILSSSASGYLIIPKLPDGKASMIIGFPKNEWPEQKVTCTIDKKDAGYVLKNFGEKGWGLFNWQTMDVVMADTKKEEPVVVVETKQENTVASVKTEAPVQQQENMPVQTVQKKEPATPVSAVRRLLSNNTPDGTEMVFTDMVNGVTDTIRLFIPADKKNGNIKAEAPADVVKENPVKEEKPLQQEPSLPKLSEQPLAVKNEAAGVVEEKKPVQAELPKEKPEMQEMPKAEPKTGIPNSDCKAQATEDDFMKLRKKMAAEDNDDDMVGVARKIFKSRCFTVEQVKNLSVLFLNDKGRYQFFDAAYPFVSDSYNFSSLQQLLSDEYYVTRFKAMLRH
ncbi:MAG: DUF4476 domain-containing protein [Ferruginibacter sp.]